MPSDWHEKKDNSLKKLLLSDFFKKKITIIYFIIKDK